MQLLLFAFPRIQTYPDCIKIFNMRQPGFCIMFFDTVIKCRIEKIERLNNIIIIKQYLFPELNFWYSRGKRPNSE